MSSALRAGRGVVVMLLLLPLLLTAARSIAEFRLEGARGCVAVFGGCGSVRSSVVRSAVLRSGPRWFGPVRGGSVRTRVLLC